jgi:hypothetical protein
MAIMRQFKPGQLQTGSLYPISASYALTASYTLGLDTGSLVTTASFNAFTASYTTGSFTGSFKGDGSQLTGIVSSKWTGSNPISRQSDVEITGSLRVQGSITGSLFGTASYYLENDPVFVSKSGSLATTGSNTFYGNQIISGSGINTILQVHGANAEPWAFGIYNDTYNPNQSVLAGFVDNTGEASIGTEVDKPLYIYTNANYGNPTLIISSSGVIIDAALTVNNGITGSLFGTASWATNAVTASYVQTAQTASYVLNAVSSSFSQTASFITTAQTASYVLQSVSASFATSALTASYVLPLRQDVQLTGSLTISGSTTQIGTNTLLGNTLLSGSLTISGSSPIGSPSPTIQIYGDIRQSGYHRFDPVNTNIDTSVSASYIYVSGSTQDLYFSQNNTGYNNVTRLRWLEGNLYTGLLHGGLITTASSTIYRISSGSGIIVNLNASLANDPFPVIQFLQWGNLSASIAPLTASYQQAFVGIDTTGNIFAQGTPFSNGQFDSIINIGGVFFQNQSTINGVKTQPSVAYGFEQQQNVFNRAFGPLKLSGYTLAPSGSSTGSLIVASGTAYAPGSNYAIDPNEPYYTVDNGTNVSKIFRYHQSGSTWVYNTNGGAGFATINPSQYSNNGTLTTVQPNDWSIQRVFWFPNSVIKAIVVYYGNQSYSTESDAIANINIESFVEAPNTSANAIYLGAIIIRGNGVLTTPADFTIVPGGLFRQVGGSGGGGSIITQTLSGLSDVSISGPLNGQPLVYNNTSGKWQNLSTLTADLTGNASTATSASFASTASYIVTAQTASYVLNAVSASFATSASRAVSSSFAATSSAALLDLATGDTRSYALTMVLSSSAAPSTFTSPRNPSPLAVRNELVFNGNTGVLQTTASVALTSSIATTASYAINSDTIFPVTAGKGINYITIIDQTGSYQYVKATPKFLLNIPDVSVDPSLILTGSIIASSITSSLQGTASFATSASNSITASNAISASFATSASRAISSSFATSASYSDSASFAVSASWAPAPTPGGSNSHIQFNDSGSFGGNPALFFNKTIEALANGKGVKVKGEWSHAQGDATTAIGKSSHAEGQSTTTGISAYSCSINAGIVEIDATQGDLTGTYPDGITIWYGDISSVGNSILKGIVTGSMFNGTNTVFQLLNDTSTTIAAAGIVDKSGNVTDQLGGAYAHAEGGAAIAIGDYSHAEGVSTTYGPYSHAEGTTVSYGDYSHAEGEAATAYGYASHAEGNSTTAIGQYSHAEGISTTSGYNAYSTFNIAAGVITFANYYGDLSATFAPGTIIYVDDLAQKAVLIHEVASVSINGNGETEVTLVDTTYDPQAPNYVGVQGQLQPTYADQPIGNSSHAEGESTITLGYGSHAAGLGTITHGHYQSVVGQYNAPVPQSSSFVIGDGADSANLHNLLVAGNGSVSISGSLTTSGSAVNLETDSFTVSVPSAGNILEITNASGVQIASTNGQISADFETRTTRDSANINSIDWDNRQLIQSDGATITLDWETGAMTGSFTGSFVGDGSGLTGVGATEYIRRSDYTGSLDPNVNYLYTGYAPVGSAESATVWTLSRLAISASGDTITQVTASAAWTNRYSYTYL